MTAPASSPPPIKAKNELVSRVITGVVLAVVSMSIIWWHLYPFAALVSLFAVIGLREFYRFGERKGLRPGKRLGLIVTLCLIASAVFFSETVMNHVLLLGLIVTFSVLLLRPQERVSPFLDSALTALGIVYVGWFFSYLIHLRKMPDGAALITLLVVATAFTDMGGYFIGRKFGRVKLYPRVSPKKTVEGALGGVLTAVVGCCTVGYALGLPLVHCPVAAVLVAIVGQMGDLFESSLKRDVGVKDSGTALQGHGGALDRFDSLAFAAPIFYLYAVHFML
jgi:phosphatidate cytidylyltransferase